MFEKSGSSHVVKKIISCKISMTSFFISSPLASYNSLQDKHLNGYFSTSRMKRHLIRSGLVRKFVCDCVTTMLTMKIILCKVIAFDQFFLQSVGDQLRLFYLCVSIGHQKRENN